MFIPEVSEGESLSSWMYRITLQRMCNRYYDASHIGEFEAGEVWAHSTHSSTSDPDFLETNVKLSSFIKQHGVAREYLAEKFGPCKQPLVPIQYRRSYCNACLEEGLKTTRSFVCKLEWRHLLQPFCAAHRILLRDCSGLMKPDTHLGENARQIEVSDVRSDPRVSMSSALGFPHTLSLALDNRLGECSG